MKPAFLNEKLSRLEKIVVFYFCAGSVEMVLSVRFRLILEKEQPEDEIKTAKDSIAAGSGRF